jgi:hypothetical protein
MNSASPVKPVIPAPGGWQRWLLLSLLLAAFALRLHELTRQNIWWDEARNIDVALRPFAQIATAPELDIQPPVYFWLLHLLGRAAGLQVGDNPVMVAFVARFLSVAAGVIAVAWLYPLAHLAFSPPAGLYATLLAVLSPFWLAESQEARMYTVGFALLTSAAVGLLRVISDWRLGIDAEQQITPNLQSLISNLPNYVAFVVLSALALLTHYNVLFILVAWYSGWGLWALLRPDRWRRLRTILFCALATALLVAPIVPVALRQIPDYANPNLTIPTIGDYLWQNWQAYLGGYAFDPAFLGGSGVIWLWGVLVIGVLGIGYWVFLSTLRQSLIPNPQSLIPLLFLLTWVVGGLVLYYAAVLDRGAFHVRYSSFITPALYGLLGGALTRWQRWWRPLGLFGLTLVVAGLLPAIRADLYDARFAREDIAGVTNWLRTVAGPADLILVDQKYPFGFYYQRYTIDPAATPLGAEAAPARYLFVDIHTLDAQLNRWARDARQIFWVQWFESDTDPRHAVPFLLDQVGQRAGAQSFQGYSIDWWVLKPPTTFTLPQPSLAQRFAFPPAVETVALALPTSPIRPGRGAPVVIQWQRMAGGEVTRPLKARVALYNANDDRLVQSDERLLNDRHRKPDQWQLTDQPLNVYWLPTPADLPAGEYELRLLVYDEETLEPLGLMDAGGNPAGMEAVLGKVQVADSERDVEP